MSFWVRRLKAAIYARPFAGGTVPGGFPMRVFGTLLVVLLSACATSPPKLAADAKSLDQSAPSVGPNGGTAHLMHCDDGLECYKRAKGVCPNGYVVFDSIDHSSSEISFHYIAFECRQ
jgi:hypothetical protein